MTPELHYATCPVLGFASMRMQGDSCKTPLSSLKDGTHSPLLYMRKPSKRLRLVQLELPCYSTFESKGFV